MCHPYCSPGASQVALLNGSSELFRSLLHSTLAARAVLPASFGPLAKAPEGRQQGCRGCLLWPFSVFWCKHWCKRGKRVLLTPCSLRRSERSLSASQAGRRRFESGRPLLLTSSHLDCAYPRSASHITQRIRRLGKDSGRSKVFLLASHTMRWKMASTA
jgi:hypothetical protein